MTGGDLPDEDNVVRYVNPRQFDKDKGIVNGSAFWLKAEEAGLSVHWLGCFKNLAKAEQVDRIRCLSRLAIRKNGRFAELNAGKTKQLLQEELASPRFIHKPLSATATYEADPSHSEILGLPDFSDKERSEFIGDLVVDECIEDVHPVLPES